MSRPIPALRRLLVAAVVGAMATGLTATAAQAVTDAPSYYKSATTTSAQGRWIPGVMETTRDVDVYRFSTTVNRYARVLLGDLAQNYRHDAAGRYARLAKGLTFTGAAVVAGARGSRALGAAGGALLMAGSVATRWAVFKAGIASALDPRQTVEPQRRRARARAAPPA